MINKWFNITYPRCGSSFLRYFARTIMNQTVGLVKNNIQSDILYIQIHFPPIESPINFPLDKINGIILTLRDYKECFLRHYRHRMQQLNYKDEFVLHKPPHRCAYYRNIEFYDSFTKPKLLIYYSDLMLNTAYELNRLADFLGYNCKDFIDNLEYHQQTSLRLYETVAPDGKSATQGKDLKFHQQKLTIEQKMNIDKIAKECNPVLYEKYLKRYETTC